VGPTKDYIRRPKENGYRSLHTVVRGDDGHDIEVGARPAPAGHARSCGWREPEVVGRFGAARFAAGFVSGRCKVQGLGLSRAGLLAGFQAAAVCQGGGCWLAIRGAAPLTAALCRPVALQVQIRTAKMHYFAEYGADAAHWQYKERGYGGVAPAAAPLSSRDDGSGCGAAREANWAKWVLSQQVHDQKFRPSGSPGQDTSLASIVGAPLAPGERTVAAAAVAAASSSSSSSSSSSEGPSPAGSPPRDARFAAYLERSGQVLAPPPEERVVVAVVRGGGLEVTELPAGSRLAGLLAAAGLRLPEAQVLVNGQLEGSGAVRIRTGDIVEVYEAEAATVPAAQPLPGVLAARQPARLPAVAVDAPLPSGPAKVRGGGVAGCA
jgi:hypothetical protein